jgi:long-chain acyl-CoA synthetase
MRSWLRAASIGGSPGFATLTELVDAFGARAERAALYAFGPDRMQVITYAQLADAIDATAQGLHARGIGRGDRVLICAPNSPEWIVAYFAVVRAGATAIPFDNQSTVASIAAVIEHANPRLILTSAAHYAELGAHGVAHETESLLFDVADTDPQSARRLRSAAQGTLPDSAPADVASLLYTSGTTGTPKAVPLTHANFAANATALLNARLIGADDRVLLPLPLHHAYPFTVGLLNALGSGAAVVLPSGISGPEIGRAAREAGATALLAVPRLCTALWDSVAAAVNNRSPRARRAFFALLSISIAVRRATGIRLGRLLFGEVHERLGNRLELVGCGGAKLDGDLARRLEGLGWTVLTGYGLTETSPVLTFNDWRHARLDSEGRPLDGVEIVLRPGAGEADAEILARGPNVFQGYWNNEQETAKAFTPDGWFRTGDLGWFDKGGYLHVAGRSKELIVLPDGKKVFPEDLEKLYGAAPLIHEVAVLEHGGGLVALVVPNERAVRERGALRESALLREQIEDLAALLPPYQRIGDFRLARDPLPRTQLGKLKRHLLGALYRDAAKNETRAPSAALADEDRKLLESARGRAAWEWLRARYPGRELSLDTSPQLDLQIDSLEWVTLTIEIEQRFKLVVTGDAVSHILTLRDLLREIEHAEPATADTAAAGVGFVPPGPAMRAVGAVLFAVVRLVMRTAFRLTVDGVERLPAEGPIVITPNHGSYLDPLAVAAALPWRRLRKTYWAGWVGVLYTGPLTRFVSRATQVFPIDPDRDLAGAIRTARALLEQGYSIVWFPEGRRSPTGELEPFQAGVGLLLESGTAVAVPVAIRGTFEAWPKHQRWPRLHAVDVAFGEPIGPTAATDSRRGSAEGVHTALEESVRTLLAAQAASKSDR